MNDLSAADEPRPRRRWPIIVAVAASLAIVGGSVAFALSTRGPGQEASTAPTPAPTQTSAEQTQEASDEPLAIAATPTPGPVSDDETVEVARAESVATALVSVVDEIGQRADGSAVGAEAIATGFVLGEIQAKAREQLDLGYTQVGEAVITSITATDVNLAGEPPTMTLTVCVDVSKIDVLDAAGNSLKASLYNPGHPVAHVYGAEFIDDTWKISSHDIPDQQTCAA